MYVGDDVPAIYDRYDYEAFGTRLTYQFNTFRVREQDEEELRADPRPFALIILANLLMLKSKNDPEKRLSFKQHLYLLAAERKYSAAVTQSIITFAEEVMRLPDELELVFQDFVLNTSTSQNMSYVPQNTLNLADAIAKKHYGYTITEMEVSLSQKDEALSQKDETISQKDEALSQTIVRLFTQKKMNATEIADITGLDIADIHNTLSRYSL